MELDIDRLPQIWTNFQNRWSERDARMSRLDSVVRGDLSIFDPDEEQIESKSPNLVQVALEDTAEAASLLPTVRAHPVRANRELKRTADRMEKIAAGYLSAAKTDLLIPQINLDLAGHGLSVLVVWPDEEQNIPLIERRDPRTCYPEPGFRYGDTVRRCIFARDLYVTQLPPEYREKLQTKYEQLSDIRVDENLRVTVVEWFSDTEYVIAGLFTAERTYAGYHTTGRDAAIPVEFDRIENKVGICPVVIGQRRTFDGEPRGQFDQIINPFEAHVRLMGTVLDYADQAVYSDIWVKDPIGELPWGGGAYIELGPNGAIGRVPPAVSSLDVQKDLAYLTDSIHLGGRWPKSRPGEVDQAIASAKFVEATTGVMNTAIRQYHLTVKYMLEQALRVAFLTDEKLLSGAKTVEGTLRNQQFVEDYETSWINCEEVRVEVDYGMGLGRDPAQAAVLYIQWYSQGFVSKETVMENIDGITDIARELARIDTEKLTEMMFAKLLAGLETGAVPEKALLDIIRARENGKALADLYEQYIVKPAEEKAEAALGSGLEPGTDLPPGLAPGGAVGPDGSPLPPEMAGGAPPPIPPPPPEILARLNTNAGPSGQLGVQIQGPV